MRPLDISAATCASRAGMDAVSNSARGTARGARITREDWRMAGKTGTSQVRNITAAERARGVISQRPAAVGAARPRAVRGLRAL